jgi:hypothetical protein
MEYSEKNKFTSDNKGYEVQEIWHKKIFKGSQISFSQIYKNLELIFKKYFCKLLISLNVMCNKFGILIIIVGSFPSDTLINNDNLITL